MKRCFYALVAATVAFSIHAASADILDNLLSDHPHLDIPDEAARAVIKHALDRIHTVECEKGKPCQSASAAEYEQPPISDDDARAAMIYAVRSALATWCQLDFRRNFLPVIALGKHKKGLSDRQLQLFSLIHGDFYGRQLISFQQKGACPANFKERLDAALPKL